MAAAAAAVVNAAPQTQEEKKITPVPAPVRRQVNPAIQAELKVCADAIEFATAIKQAGYIRLGPNTSEIFVNAQVLNQHQVALCYHMFGSSWLWPYIEMLVEGLNLPGEELPLYDQYVFPRGSFLKTRINDGQQTFYVMAWDVVLMWREFVKLYIRTHRGAMDVPEEVKERLFNVIRAKFDKNSGTYTFSFYFWAPSLGVCAFLF